MHIFEREVNGHRYRIAAQSVWDAERGRSVARQVVLGRAEPPPLADRRATHTVGTRGVGDVGALIWVAEQLDLVAHIDRACAGAGQLHEKLFTHNGLRMGVVNCCEDAFTLGFAKSREWCGRRIRAVEFARRVWGPEGAACTHPGA